MDSLSIAGRARTPSSRRRAVALLVLVGAALAQPQRTEPTHAPVKFESPVQDKNFYLLSMIERTPAVRDAVKSDPVLSRIAASRLTGLDTAAKSCAVKLDCHTDAFRWSDEQSAEAAHALSGLYRSSPAVRAFADGPLRASGMYVRYHGHSGEELLDHAFADCIRGVNHIIDVYGLGKAPRYPAIDAIAYDVKSVAWPAAVQNLTAVLEDGHASLELFFAPSLRFAVELLLLNQRDEAGRLEPLEAGENAEAFGRIPMVDWDRYAYSVIVVPGAGNDRPGVRLSPGGLLRDELAARRYREGKAPFVLVSGGFVHPERTEFAEALEMKHDLMRRFGLPANAIIVEPHARHTTTNMRNAARLMYRYGMPFGKKALVTTDLGQSASIESPAFEKRCLTELGYAPQRILGRISPFDLEFLPMLDSLHGDPQDPLDP
jgi:hypothetical protein